MNKILILLLITFSAILWAGPNCLKCKPVKFPRYVCFDGRVLKRTSSGLQWNAKRGCFVSRCPCCAFDAVYYGFYPNPREIDGALQECRAKYPFHWGEMQTH